MSYSRQVIEKQNDNLASIYVRRRDIRKYGLCPLCNKNQITGAFHFITRAKRIIRWDVELNLIGSCWPCNSSWSGKWGGGNQASGWKWYIENLGQEKFDKLSALSHQIAKYSIDELRSINAYLRGLLEKNA